MQIWFQMNWEGEKMWTNSECNNGPNSFFHKNLIAEQTLKVRAV
jgi:hypothetical protein